MNPSTALGITSGVGAAGDVLGLIGGIGQSIGAGNLERSAGGGLNDTISQELGEIGDLNTAGYNAENFGTDLEGLGTGYQSSAAGVAPMISAAGAGMQANPYLGMLGGYAPQMSPGQNPYLTQTGNQSSNLSTYQALTPQQLGLLATTGGNAALSAARTMGQQAGGVANPALLQKQLTTQAGQTGMQTAAQLGTEVAGQDLSAQEAALGGYESGAGTYLGALEGGAGVLGQAGSQYLEGEQGAGQLYEGEGSLYAGLGESDVSGANSAYGTGAGAFQGGIQGLSGIAGNYLGLLGMGAGTSPSGGNLGNLGSFLGL